MSKLTFEASGLSSRDFRLILTGLEIRLRGSRKYPLRFNCKVLRLGNSYQYIGRHRWIKTLWNRWQTWMRAKTHSFTKSVLMGKKRLALANTQPCKRMIPSKYFQKSPLSAALMKGVPIWVSSMLLSMSVRQLFLKLSLRKNLSMQMNNQFCRSKILPNSSYKTQAPFKTLQMSKSSRK